jgi:hypothetical protein
MLEICLTLFAGILTQNVSCPSEIITPYLADDDQDGVREVFSAILPTFAMDVYYKFLGSYIEGDVIIGLNFATTIWMILSGFLNQAVDVAGYSKLREVRYKRDRVLNRIRPMVCRQGVKAVALNTTAHRIPNRLFWPPMGVMRQFL